jgi:hypothetical protein
MDNQSKEVKMKLAGKATGAGANKQEQPQKLSYEQLEQVARDTVMQRNQLQVELQKARQLINEFNDLGLLLDIIKHGENFSSEFIVRCIDRVEKMVSVALDNYDKMEAEMKAAKEKQEAEANSQAGKEN